MFKITTATRKIAALKKRIRILQGGTSASKTFSTLLVLIDRAQTKQSYAELTSIVAESVPHLKRGAMRDFKMIMQTHNYWVDKNWNATDSTYTFETGNQIEFFSTDNGAKLRGARRDWLFMNEANNLTYEAFQQLEVRTRYGVYIDFNPSNEFWAHTELIPSRDDVDYIILTYKDNEALSPEIVETIEKRKSNAGWWKVYGEGQLGELEGKIYTGWQIIDSIPHEAKLERYGLDFGYSVDPSVAVAIYSYNGGFIIDEVFYQKGMSNKMIADNFLNQDRAMVVADSSEPKSIDEIQSYGINIIGAIKGPGSVNQGIQFVQAQKVSVTKRSTKTIKGYRNFIWATDRDGKMLNVPDDTIHEWSNPMDAVRYGLDSFRPRKKKGKLIKRKRNSAIGL